MSNLNRCYPAWDHIYLFYMISVFNLMFVIPERNVLTGSIPASTKSLPKMPEAYPPRYNFPVLNRVLDEVCFGRSVIAAFTRPKQEKKF